MARLRRATSWTDTAAVVVGLALSATAEPTPLPPLGATVEPGITVGANFYDKNTLAGCDSAAVKLEVETEVRSWSDDQLRAYIAARGGDEDREEAAHADTNALRRLVDRVCQARLWQDVVLDAVDAATTDAIAQDLGLSLADHFDLAKVRDALAREAGLQRVLDEARRAGALARPDLLGELRARYRLRLSDAEWSAYLAEYQRQPRLSAELHRLHTSQSNARDVAVKAALLGDLLKSALAEGPYGRQATPVVRTESGGCTALQVEGWRGPLTELDAAVHEAIDAQGNWREERRDKLVAWLRRYGFASVSVTSLSGADAVRVAGETVCGRATRLADGCYAWAAPSPPAAAGPAPDAARVWRYASRLASRRWRPSLIVHSSGWGNPGQLYGVPLRYRSAADYAALVVFDPYVMKPVTAEVFDQYEAGLPRFQTVLAKLTAANLVGSVEQLAVAKAEAAKLAKEAEPVWRRHYEALSAR